MSDEESFVILGTSPMSSLETSASESRNSSFVSSTEFNSPEKFNSLKSDQLHDLKNAQENGQQDPNQHPAQSERALKSQMSQMSISEGREELIGELQWLAGSNSRQVKENSMKHSLEHYALKSLLEDTKECVNEEIPSSKVTYESILPPEVTRKADNNLASSFIMGEITTDAVKRSFFSQFPSVSIGGYTEEVRRLEELFTECTQLKSTLKMANNTMKQYYDNSLQWKDKMKLMEEQYRDQLDKCKSEVEELRKQNNEIENNFKQQIEALEIVRKKDREENIQEISEKSAVLENMRAQIIKLEQQQLISSGQFHKKNGQFNKSSITTNNVEHDIKIKELERQLSEMLASNLDLSEIQKQYIDELNCLKVNLVAAEELIMKDHAEINQLTALNMTNNKQIETLENCLKSIQAECDEQKIRISLLETQNVLHRSDFEMEKVNCETAVKEKQQILCELRCLQKRNQALIEEQNRMANEMQRRLSTEASTNNPQITAASAAAQHYFPNPQRPIINLPSSSRSTANPGGNICPICNCSFKSLHVLLSHVNECVDKTANID